MGKDKIVERTCIACREVKDKRQLVRIVKNANGEIAVDFTGKANGRGAYVCPTKECFEKLKKRKALQRAFNCEIPQMVFDTIEEGLFGTINE